MIFDKYWLTILKVGAISTKLDFSMKPTGYIKISDVCR